MTQLTPDQAIGVALEEARKGNLEDAGGLIRQVLELVPGHLPAILALQLVESERRLAALSATVANVDLAIGGLTKTQGCQFLATLLSEARFGDPKRLERFGAKCFSQNDEDGIIAEIFRRIGTTNRTFLEIGVDDGLQCNTHLLLHQGWAGAWIQADRGQVEAISRTFAAPIVSRALRVVERFVNRETVNDVVSGLGLPYDIDLLSIDIDGNDYYVFDVLTAIAPRVVIVEYNAQLPPPTRAVIPYRPDWVWRGDGYFGASLQSLTDLASRKGYRLVGCNVTGVNAFFVRNDQARDLFQDPPDAANFYHPARYFLGATAFMPAHPVAFGPYVSP